MRLGVEAALVDGVLLKGDVEVQDGRIAGVGLAGRGRGHRRPGFRRPARQRLRGVDFAAADAAGYRTAGAAMLETGVTAFQPTFISAGEAELAASLAEVPDEPIGPRLLGVHLEGPSCRPSMPASIPSSGSGSRPGDGRASARRRARSATSPSRPSLPARSS